MGIFDKLKAIFKPTPEQKAERLLARISNMYSQTQDRQYYLHQTRELGGELAAKNLIRRFTCTCENSTVDADEKELTMQLLLSLGQDAVEPLKHHLFHNDKDFNWPYRTLAQIIDEAELISFLIEILEEIGPEYVRDPERKEQIMLIAKSFDSEPLAKAILPYLGDDNETIRFVAADSAIAHAYPFNIEALSERLALEESQRVIAHIADAFKTNGWTVSPCNREEITSRLPQAYKLRSNCSIA
ncbi:MAG: hypothetical protein WC966_05035 [Bradymonadales bacterium]|jgi:hypothetical protein